MPWTKSFDAGLALVLRLGQIRMVEGHKKRTLCFEVEMRVGTVEVICLKESGNEDF